MATDNRAIIINQMMKKQLGLENPLVKLSPIHFKLDRNRGCRKLSFLNRLKTRLNPLAMFAGKSTSIVFIRATQQMHLLLLLL